METFKRKIHIQRGKSSEESTKFGQLLNPTNNFTNVRQQALKKSNQKNIGNRYRTKLLEKLLHFGVVRESSMEEDSILKLVVFGVVSWTLAFLFFRKILPNRSFDFCNRLVSAIHATLAVTLASLSVQDWRCPVCPLASDSSPRQMQALAVTLAYLLYDTVCCMFDQRVGVDNIIHHLVSIVGIGAGLISGKSGSELVAALWVTETSSPFLHMREMLKELGYRDTGLNLIADATFAVIFTLARMVCGPYITFVTVCAGNAIIIKAMGVGLQLVSAFWFVKIARMMKYKLAKLKSKKAV